MYRSHPNAIAHAPIPYGTPSVVRMQNALPNSDVSSMEQNHQNGMDNACNDGISLPKEEDINNKDTIDDSRDAETRRKIPRLQSSDAG